MAQRKVVKCRKMKNAKIPWHIELECGHARYFPRRKKVGTQIECTRGQCGYEF